MVSEDGDVSIDTMLTDDEIARYRRHLVLKEIGGEGQKRLKSARVLVVGAGGLGSPLILYLAAAGVGQIGVIDDDFVSVDNLQRQVLHRTASIGHKKTQSAASSVQGLNPHVDVKLFTTRLDERRRTHPRGPVPSDLPIGPSLRRRGPRRPHAEIGAQAEVLGVPAHERLVEQGADGPVSAGG